MPFVAKRGLPKSHRGTTYQKPIIEVRRAPAHPVGKLIPSAKLSDELGRLIADDRAKPTTNVPSNIAKPTTLGASHSHQQSPNQGEQLRGREPVSRRRPVASKRAAAATAQITGPRPTGANRNCPETPAGNAGQGPVRFPRTCTPRHWDRSPALAASNCNGSKAGVPGDCRCRRDDSQAGGNFSLLAIPCFQVSTACRPALLVSARRPTRTRAARNRPFQSDRQRIISSRHLFAGYMSRQTEY